MRISALNVGIEREGRLYALRWRWEKEAIASLRDPEDSGPLSSKASRIWFICTILAHPQLASMHTPEGQYNDCLQRLLHK